MTTDVDARMLEDIRSMLAKGPELFSDIVGRLRCSTATGGTPSGRRWRRINEHALKDALKAEGFCFGVRRHASGLATYIYTEPFTTVTDWYGRAHEVHAD